jgi:hypothetical protein
MGSVAGVNKRGWSAYVGVYIWRLNADGEFIGLKAHLSSGFFPFDEFRVQFSKSSQHVSYAVAVIIAKLTLHHYAKSV